MSEYITNLIHILDLLLPILPSPHLLLNKKIIPPKETNYMTLLRQLSLKRNVLTLPVGKKNPQCILGNE